jgi:hypothetical protein
MDFLNGTCITLMNNSIVTLHIKTPNGESIRRVFPKYDTVDGLVKSMHVYLHNCDVGILTNILDDHDKKQPTIEQKKNPEPAHCGCCP